MKNRFPLLGGAALFFLCMLFPCTPAGASVLSPEDRDLYRQVFELQEEEKIKEAEPLAARIQNPILMPYVEAQKFLSRTYKTRSREVNRWLQENRGHPDALAVYELAARKSFKPPGPKPRAVPERFDTGVCHEVEMRDPIDLLYRVGFGHLKAEDRRRASRLMRRIYLALKRGKTRTARVHLESAEAKRLFGPLEYDSVRTALAFAYFIDLHDDKALELAQAAFRRSGKRLPLAYWVAGLVSFRREDYKAAGVYFRQAAETTSYPGLAAAGAFWAARASLKTGEPEKTNELLMKAAESPRTFYGLIARRALGEDILLSYRVPARPEGGPAAPASEETALKIRRFQALLEVGLEDKAYDKLLLLYGQGDEDAKSLLIMMLEEEDRTDTAYSLLAAAGKLEADDAAYYPIPTWRPQEGWRLDRALVFAFIRQESCFNKRAMSNRGARGLMQIMPQTANLMARKMGVKNWSRPRLFDPLQNLHLGQAYISHLLELPAVSNNLFFLMAAYNGGPGNLIKWKNRMDYGNDPLMFVESLPSQETRQFIRRVSGNLWVYRSLLQQRSVSLDELVAGGFPTYTSVEQDTGAAAKGETP